MKHYLLEPTYKKSVLEFDLFKRKEEDGTWTYLRKELGWRWGAFMFSVPETEEEVMEYLKNQGYENALDWALDYGHTVTDENGEEVLDGDIAELIASQLTPSEDDSFVDITEDYDMEMLYCDDGCWETWDIYNYQNEDILDDEEKESLIEEVQEAWEEEYQEGVEDLGWEYVDNYFEMHCNPKITPCDENGKTEEEETDE